MVGGCRGGPGGGRSPSGVAGGGPSPWQGASSRSDAVIVVGLWRSWAGLVGDDHRGDRRGRVRTIAAVWCGGVGRSRGQGASPRPVPVIVAGLWRSWAWFVGDDHGGGLSGGGRVRTICVGCGEVGQLRRQGGRGPVRGR